MQCVSQVEVTCSSNSRSDSESELSVDLPELAEKQRDDPEFAPIFAYLQDGVLPENAVLARRWC